MKLKTFTLAVCLLFLQLTNASPLKRDSPTSDVRLQNDNYEQVLGDLMRINVRQVALAVKLVVLHPDRPERIAEVNKALDNVINTTATTDQDVLISPASDNTNRGQVNTPLAVQFNADECTTLFLQSLENVPSFLNATSEIVEKASSDRMSLDILQNARDGNIIDGDLQEWKKDYDKLFTDLESKCPGIKKQFEGVEDIHDQVFTNTRRLFSLSRCF
ncbi:hypothetical protein FE257_001029 [Aspergillus nanangensis]|uniref:Uncharacterized protein n=1 Tax=Aspergillus nanangensis TaxID=2582783 RepID=A0AAD4CUB6_ASPNN|nr:hypothetical protein FE257_001029 [Aspergillus nanangensis]